MGPEGLEKLLTNHLEGYATDVWTKEPPSNKDKLNIKWLDDHFKGRILVNPHTAYYSEEALYESRSKACATCLEIINNRLVKNRIV